MYCELAELDVVEQVVTGKKAQPLSGKKIEFVRVELDTEETCPIEVQEEETTAPACDSSADSLAPVRNVVVVVQLRHILLFICSLTF